MQTFKPGDRVCLLEYADQRVWEVFNYYGGDYWTLRTGVGALLVYYTAHISVITPFLPLATTRFCPYCYKLPATVRVRELCTNYGDDDDLFDGCQACFDDYNNYYKELIEDYYAGCLS